MWQSLAMARHGLARLTWMVSKTNSFPQYLQGCVRLGHSAMLCWGSSLRIIRAPHLFSQYTLSWGQMPVWFCVRTGEMEGQQRGERKRRRGKGEGSETDKEERQTGTERDQIISQSSAISTLEKKNTIFAFFPVAVFIHSYKTDPASNCSHNYVCLS